MRKIKYWHLISILMFIPMIIGVFSIKTVKGAVMFGVSITIATMIESILAVIEKEIPTVNIIIIDFIAVISVLCIILKFYFKRDDIVIFVGLMGLIFIIIYSNYWSKLKK